MCKTQLCKQTRQAICQLPMQNLLPGVCAAMEAIDISTPRLEKLGTDVMNHQWEIHTMWTTCMSMAMHGPQQVRRILAHLANL